MKKYINTSINGNCNDKNNDCIYGINKLFLYYDYYSVSANLVPVVRQAEPFAGQPISSSLRAS